MKKEKSKIEETPIPNTVELVQSAQNLGTNCSCDTAVENDDATGDNCANQKVKKFVYRFDRYDITVLLTENDKFLGILSVKETRDFLSKEQFLGNTPSINTDSFYEEEDN